MRALVAYSASSTYVQTTLDYLNSFKIHTGFETHYVHVTHGANIEFDFDSYDVIFHNYCARLCFPNYISPDYENRLRSFGGVKILSVQDEYDNTDLLKNAIKRMEFDIVLTCVPQSSLEYVYPKVEFPHVKFITVFTGYVVDEFGSNPAPWKPLSDRPVTIGYRGRDIGGRYGRLGFDKYEIGRRMKDICEQRGIAHDIAMDERSRIYGAAWFDFLGSCRAMLGTESGSNVFDFDGSIDATFREMEITNGGARPSYQQFLPIVAKRDSEISMGQISPRVFECAMMRTPMILFRGHYSGAVSPDEHYIPLDKDFSNIDIVLKKLNDFSALEEMTARTYDHLVASGQFSYRRFFAMVSDLARQRARGKPKGSTTSIAAARATFNVREMHAIELPSLDPDNADGFSARTSIPTIKTLLGEIERLEGEFQRHLRVCLDWIEHLQTVADEQIQGIINTLVIKYVPIKKPELNLDQPIFHRELTKFKERDAKWGKSFDQYNLTRDDLFRNSVDSSQHKIVTALLAACEGRHKDLCSRFVFFNEHYDRDQKALNFYIVSLNKFHESKYYYLNTIFRRFLMIPAYLVKRMIFLSTNLARKMRP